MWQNFIDGFRRFDYQNVDFENMGSWPVAIKILACIIVAAAVGAGGYYGLVKSEYDSLTREQRTEQSLRQQYEEKAFQVANLEAYKAQLTEMQETFGALLEQLPNETEISGLLDDITFTGIQSGLDFDSLALGAESTSELFIETPINIVVRGGYHEMGTFVSGLSALPRIVTLHDFSISRASGVSRSANSDVRAPLLMNIQAKTYRYKSGDAK